MASSSSIGPPPPPPVQRAAGRLRFDDVLRLVVQVCVSAMLVVVAIGGLFWALYAAVVILLWPFLGHYLIAQRYGATGQLLGLVWILFLTLSAAGLHAAVFFGVRRIARRWLD